MFFSNKIRSYFFATLLLSTAFVAAEHDVLVEGKASAFMPTGDVFKEDFGTSGLFGFEITAKIVGNVYGFGSFDFISKSGQTVFFESASKVYTSNFGLGLKYFIPTSETLDFYVGLGAQPTYLRTIDGSDVETEHQRWGWGGIAKIGAIINLPGSFFVDLFIDYSFVKIDFTTPFGAPIQSADAILNGAIFGLGFGYRFN
ncbi:outer membrane beta-barrel protein [Candidatus Babeliales bacterium]|nr:outer membrane beta-barrel protein [Candidatus Babeliales bacterium]MBP9844375.1 outer membrane beta-barrel protein [Candidatus Babeliales bacterium]